MAGLWLCVFPALVHLRNWLPWALWFVSLGYLLMLICEWQPDYFAVFPGCIVCSWVEMIKVPWVVSLVGLLLVPGVWACLYLVGLPVGICWLCSRLMPLFL